MVAGGGRQGRRQSITPINGAPQGDQPQHGDQRDDDQPDHQPAYLSRFLGPLAGSGIGTEGLFQLKIVDLIGRGSGLVGPLAGTCPLMGARGRTQRRGRDGHLLRGPLGVGRRRGRRAWRQVRVQDMG